MYESVISSSVTSAAVCQSAQKYLGTTTTTGGGTWSLGTYAAAFSAFSSRGTPIAIARDPSNKNTSEFGCPSTAISLPIELLLFNAKKLNETSVKTYWKTASEINNDYFTIERSVNGIDFEKSIPFSYLKT